MNLKFRAALAAYAILGILAVFTLDGEFRIGTLVFLGGMALKTWLVLLKQRMD